MPFDLPPFRLSRAPAKFAGPTYTLKIAAPPSLVADIDLAARILGMGRAEFMRASAAYVASRVAEAA